MSLGRDVRGNDAMRVAVGGSSTGDQLRAVAAGGFNDGSGTVATTPTPVIATARIVTTLNVDLSALAPAAARQRGAREHKDRSRWSHRVAANGSSKS